MTTMQGTRPMSAPISRAPGGAPSGGMSFPTIDPIKLVKRYKWLLIGAAAVGAVLGTISNYALLYTSPIYTSEMVFQCDSLKSNVDNNVSTSSDKEIQMFMATQVQIMLSNRIIDKSAADPALLRDAPKFAQQFMSNGTLNTTETARAIKRHLSAGVLGETQLVRAAFTDSDPVVATAVLKIVGENYRRENEKQFQDASAGRRGGINITISELEKKIETQRAARKRLLQDQSVDSLDQSSNGARSKINQLQEQMVKLIAERQSYTVQRDDMERQLASPAGITYSDTIRQKVQEHPVMLRLVQDLAAQEASLTGLRARLGAQHRNVLQLQDYVDGMRQKIETKREELMREEFNGMLDKLKTAIAGDEATEADYLKQLEEAKSRAAELAQTLSAVKEIDQQIDGWQADIRRFETNRSTFDLVSDSRVKIQQDPILPKTVTFPKLIIMIPLGIFAVLGLTAGVVLLRELLDQRVKSPADVALIPRTRVLGLIPHSAEDPGAPSRIETVFRDQPRGIIAESYRQLRGALWKRMQQGGYRSLAVMSGMPQSGATTVAINLAYAFAASEHRVLLIDANMRRPSIHKVLGLGETPGLADVLSGATSFSQAAQKTDAPLLSVLSAGSPDKRVYERLSSSAMSELLAAAGSDFDVVLLDVAPAMVAGDAMALANRCDASLLVVRALGEKRGMVARIRNDLSESKAEFMGVLVNAVRSSAGGYLKGNIMAAHAYQNGEPDAPKES
jgi:capsular exopolysaccharide synthesis family protein